MNKKILLNDGKVDIICDVDISDDQLDILIDFNNEALRLFNLLKGRDYAINLNMHGKVDENINLNVKLPKEDDLIVLIHGLRPFILVKEPFNFYKTSKLLKRIIPNELIRIYLDSLNSIFEGTSQQNVIKITLNNEKVINSTNYLMDYLNAYEYHRDQDKRVFFEKLYSTMPDTIDKYSIVSLLIDKTKAIYALARVAGLLTGHLEKLVIST